MLEGVPEQIRLLDSGNFVLTVTTRLKIARTIILRMSHIDFLVGLFFLHLMETLQLLRNF